MKFSLTSIALVSLMASASAKSLQQLKEFAQKLQQHDGRKLQLSESYGFNQWGEGNGFLDSTQEVDIVFDGTDPEVMLPSILDIVSTSDDHTSLFAAIEAAFLVEPLREYNGIATLFAPNNEAFAAIADVSARYFQEEYVFHLIDILLYHFTEGKIMSTDLEETNITMANLEGANITLDPPMINDANIIDADIEASNGVVHSIDSVLLTPWLYVDLADIVTGIPEIFSNLAEYTEMANLTDALRGEGPFTLFAPIDFAFNQSADAVAAILESDDPIGYLTNTLQFHLAFGVYLSDTIEDGTEITMANGEVATITVEPIYADPTPVVTTRLFEDYDKLVEKEAAKSSSSSSSGDETPEEATPERVDEDGDEGPDAATEEIEEVAEAELLPELEPIDYKYSINGVEIVAGDFYVNNGVIHILGDGLMVPQNLM